MSRIIVLDAGPLGVACNPRAESEGPRCVAWIRAILAGGERVVIPAIADYEIRRELLLGDRQASLRRLASLLAQCERAPLTDAVLHDAAALWADARKRGLPTADNKALDGDVILAAQARSLEHPEWVIVVATGNVRHLSRYVLAQRWQDIVPLPAL